MTTKAEQAAALLGAVHESGEWKGFCPIHQQEHFRSPASAPKAEARNLLIRPDGTNGFPRYLCNSRGCDQQNLGAFLGALREVVGRDLVWTPPTKDDPELRQPFELPGDETLSRWTEALVSHPGWQPMRDWLWDKCRVDSGLALELGLGAHTFLDPQAEPNFGERLVIPVRNVDGELLTLRCLNPLHPEVKRRRLGWPGRDGSVLVGTDSVRDPSLLVVEGESDWLYCRALGLNAVGKTGAQGIPADLRCVERAEDVVLGFDADSAGQRGARAFAKALAEVGVGPVYLANLPLSGEKGDKDWCDWLPTRTEAVQLVKEAAVGEPFDPLSELDEDRVERGVLDQLHRDEIRKQYQDIVWQSGWRPPVYARDVAEELATPPREVDWRIYGLHERGTNTLIIGSHKSGKTSLAMNAMRSLVDGEPFLDAYPVEEIEGRVAWWDYELTPAQGHRWLHHMALVHPERLTHLPLRGRSMPFESEHVVQWAIDWLGEHNIKSWFVDPFGAAYNGDENDNRLVGDWCRALDRIKNDAGVDDVFLSAHTGRNGEERTRGAVRLEDWRDASWYVSRDKSAAGERIGFMWADGRDVDVPEFGFRLDEGSPRARKDESIGSRAQKRESRDDFNVQRLVATVISNPGKTRNELAELLNMSGSTVTKLGRKAAEQGRIRIVDGPNNSHLFQPEETAESGGAE